MSVDQILAYVVMLAASAFFISVGSILFLAPIKFVKLARWWGKQIGFPRSRYDPNDSPAFVWRNWRLPGLVVLSFGGFMLFVILRSLKREGSGVSPLSGTLSIANHHEAHWYAFASDAIPIALGIFILLRTEKILAKVKNTRPNQVNADDGLNYARYLFRAIGSIAILAGMAFLLRHILSF